MVLDTYRAIILTVDIYVVAIYCLPYSGGHKVFDSHRRDLPGMRHLYGTYNIFTSTKVQINGLSTKK